MRQLNWKKVNDNDLKYFPRLHEALHEIEEDNADEPGFDFAEVLGKLGIPFHLNADGNPTANDIQYWPVCAVFNIAELTGKSVPYLLDEDDRARRVHVTTLTDTANNLKDVIKALDALAELMTPHLPDHHQKLCDVALTGISGRIENETFAIEYVINDLDNDGQ